MDYELIKGDTFDLFGKVTQLTNSQIANYKIIRENWIEFNALLNKYQVQYNPHWKKYGVTIKRNGQYFYASAVDSIQQFDTKRISIPASFYAKFQYCGEMYNLKNFINKIYKEIIPNNSLTIDYNREIIQYEYYDKRFNFNNKNSIIDIFVPIAKE